MDELRSLAKFVTNSYSSKYVLPSESKGSGIEASFTSKLKEGQYRSDAEAAKDLYNSEPGDVRYKMLKHRVKRKFFNSLYFLDHAKLKTKPFYEKEQEALGLIQKAFVLLRYYELDLALNLAKKAYDISGEYDIVNLKIAAIELKLAVLAEQGGTRQFQQSKTELDGLLRVKYFEREAITLYQQITIELKKSVKSRKAILNEIPYVLKRLKEIWESVSTFEVFEAYYKASIWYNELVGNFKEIIKLTVSSVELLRSGKVNKLRFDSNLNKFVLVYAHLRDRDYINGLKYAEVYVESFSPNSMNWFSYMENYFLLALHNQNYTLAQVQLDKVKVNPSFGKLNKQASERWALYTTYLEVIALNSFANLKSNPFITSLPEYSKDKQGFNVAILILQFIYYLQKQETEALLYRIESLKKYIMTHLRDTFSLRSKIFLKLLILIVTEDYDVSNCRKKGQKLYDKLAEAPIPGDAYAEIEIVPYEHLWNYILFVLEKAYK